MRLSQHSAGGVNQLVYSPRLHARHDDEIFEHLKRDFPEMFEEPYDKITKLDEEAMKSKEGKEKWRKFIESCVFPPLSLDPNV